MFQGIGNLTALWKQASEIGGQLKRLQEDLKNRRTSGTAGGGMVEIEINGALDVLNCKIDPQLFAQGDREFLEDLLVAAMNQAVAKGKDLHAAALKEITGGMQLPGMQEALEKISGLGPKDAGGPNSQD
jgi:nucleoid-associated protein EbfC